MSKRVIVNFEADIHHAQLTDKQIAEFKRRTLKMLENWKRRGCPTIMLDGGDRPRSKTAAP